jgi:hypothetical protein
MNQHAGYMKKQETFSPENEQQHGDHKKWFGPHLPSPKQRE